MSFSRDFLVARTSKQGHHEGMKIKIQLTTATRCDLALLEAFNDQAGVQYSRKKIKLLIEEKKIKRLRADGSFINCTASELLPVGETFFETEHLQAIDKQYSPAPSATAAEHCFLDILFENESILVLNKRTGVPSAPLSTDTEFTLTAVNAALAHVPTMATVGRSPGNPSMEPGLLHRLDTGTSGALVFAKDQRTFDYLHRNWKENNVKKFYRAIVRWALPAPAQPLPARIDLPLGHDPKSKKRMISRLEAGPGITTPLWRKHASAISRSGDWYAAHTLIHSHKKVGARRTEENSRLDLSIEITTGVMHQIRCHLASMGWPIDGDPVYDGAMARRLWLHAERLILPLPEWSRTEKGASIITIDAPLPEGWPII